MRTLAAIALLLALPAMAHAGGWANTTLSSNPTRATAGDTWTVDMTILQHGRTPMPGLRPGIVVTRPDGRDRRFAARPTDRAGVYRTRVRFDQAGRHTYRVDDGFTNAVAHRYPAVRVGPALAAARPDTGGRPTLAWGGGALLLVAGAALAARRARNAGSRR